MVDVLWGVGGMAALLLIAVLCSSDRRAIRPRTVLAALVLQVGFGVLVLSWSVGGRALEAASSGVQAVIDSSGEGIGFLFGPVLPVVPFDTLDEALEKANATEYGLAAFVWTRDLRTAMRASEGLEFGLVGVNDWYPVTAEAPFGGMKQSGIGRESGAEGVHEYVEAKTRFFGGV